MARLVSRNVQKLEGYDKIVNMWVYQEYINGRKLTDIINTEHENVK